MKGRTEPRAWVQLADRQTFYKFSLSFEILHCFIWKTFLSIDTINWSVHDHFKLLFPVQRCMVLVVESHRHSYHSKNHFVIIDRLFRSGYIQIGIFFI